MVKNHCSDETVEAGTVQRIIYVLTFNISSSWSGTRLPPANRHVVQGFMFCSIAMILESNKLESLGVAGVPVLILDIVRRFNKIRDKSAF